ncbi:MAG TPA: hypothetical protein PLP07_12410 [Pyrinomonadaceae bacterium]|nr:hypothetical protein [Chloracidobacterium sp.]MBP9936633.1 hypothetical protein [Pyrinomonadaceae bacterium]MBK9437562.1 hypothetical protein [Chloracidobacterium sp.]MBL0240228.1 hypothetical protein [Chloracidobacterium sp.]HQX56725.1 hypothetical protein [Pyrinomonadaceae bacterium]
MNKQLITIIVLVLFSFVLSAQGQDETRSIQTWKVQKYDVSATLPSDAASRSAGFTAVLSLRNISGKSAGSLTLRISPFADITSIKINDAATDFTKSEEKVGSAGSLQRIAMRFPAINADATLTASVEYRLNLKENTSLATISPIGTQFLPLSFWYPTPTSWFFNRGGDRAPFRLRVNSPGPTVLTSGVETTSGFDEKINGQPYFVSGSWDLINSSGVAVYGPKSASNEAQKRIAELAALFAEARTFMSGTLGAAPEAPLKIIVVRRGAGFSGGGTVLIDESVLRRSKIDSLTATSIAEAAAKIWLGGSVTTSGEGYAILQEGLSRYLATQFIESKYGKDVADNERLRQRTAYAAVSKRDGPMRASSPLDDFFYSQAANKGAMAWRLLERKLGKADFSAILRANMADGDLNMAELRMAFSSAKDIVDYVLDQTTEMNLLVGIPQVVGDTSKVALRNTGLLDATITVKATTASGQIIESPTTIKAQSYGEVSFKSPSPIVRVEVDTEKLYPQFEYSDDVAPKELSDSDPILAVKRAFDKQDFAGAEKIALIVLKSSPRTDDVRILLGRALLALGRNVDAEREFKAILEEKLPSSRSLAWANVGLGETAARSGQNDEAVRFAEAAIVADAEYGASLAARNLRNRVGGTTSIDPTVKSFFADFDRAAVSNRKADVDALIMPGEASKFAGGIAGGTEQWQTQVRQIDRLDANNLLVETNLTIKLLTKDSETGMAVFRLTRSGNGWKLSGVETFELR